MDRSRFRCVKCGVMFAPDYDEDEHGNEFIVSTKLCYYCFEDGVEEAEERRRERIARNNEY